MTKYSQSNQICFNKVKLRVNIWGDKTSDSMCERGEIYLANDKWSIDNCLNVNYYQKKKKKDQCSFWIYVEKIQ